MEKIRGVNLGNWLVLEKWMDNNLFSGTQAMDETYLCAELGHDRATERLKVHRDEFITERDFEEIAFMGFNAVRIPVPFFLFEDLGPYVHCYEYLDKAFNWSENTVLKFWWNFTLFREATMVLIMPVSVEFVSGLPELSR